MGGVDFVSSFNTTNENLQKIYDNLNQGGF